MKKFFIFVPCALLACSHITKEGARIIVVNDAAAVAGCEHLGNLQAGSDFGGLMPGSSGRRQTMEKLRNQTAKMGGTHLSVVSANGGVYGASAEAEAYKCPHGYVGQSASPAPGCGKDTDCREPRICVNGQCSNPQ